MEDKMRQRLAIYIQKELDGTLSDDQFQELVGILKSSPVCRCYYARTIAAIAAFHQPSLSAATTAKPPVVSEEIFDSALWAMLSREETTAEPLVIPKSPPMVELVTNVRGRKAQLQTSPKKIPVMLWIALTSLAAMLIMMAYVVLNPRTLYEVATVFDAVQPQWSSSLPPQKGVRLAASSEQIELHRGIVKIETDKGVQVILEAPAKFCFLSPDEVFLSHGRLVAYVPESGNGFSVQTNTSKIIDLGTKFGVYAEKDDNVELHLFKGKTLLITGKSQGGKQTAEIVAGRAVRIDCTSQSLTDVPLRKDIFVHDIDSQTGLVWRDQRVINLADVVGGGNGFGTGTQGAGINPASGVFRMAEGRTRKHPNLYTPVESNPYVDGVFVPDGSEKQVVTSAGHLFEGCPPTSGFFYMDIANTPMSRIINDEKLYPLYLNQTNYSAKENPSILLHSNAGITFDLNQYRSRMPGIKIGRFQSEVGISDSAPVQYIADLYILVDGRIRFQNTKPLRHGDTIEVDIAINDHDRFLTLMVSDGSVHGIRQDENAIGYDWVVFGRPFLTLE